MTPQAANAPTLPSDPELGHAATVAATTVATDGRKKRTDPFTLISGESISPQVEASGADIEGTAGERRYERGAVIGAGGMGEVRLHADRRIGRRVAKKTLHSTLDSSNSRQRFLREARVQGQLEHPAIVPVYDLDVDERGHPFFTMKRVRGLTLERVLERLRAGDAEAIRRFSVRKLLTAFAQVCLAIDYAHTRGVIHRDLKPGNIMLGDFGEVYVLDWGLAKVIGEPEEDGLGQADVAPVVGASVALTRRDSLLGTPAYMAPEQLLRITHEVDARSDIYALGSILFEILSRVPLRQTTEISLILKHLADEEAARPSSHLPSVAPELDELCARALRRDPQNRVARARELAEGVERFLDGEHDATLRKELSSKHAETARDQAKNPPARVEAFRETMKALALDPENGDAQNLLVDLLTNVSGEMPDKAANALRAANNQSRAVAAKQASIGLLLWLMIFPAVVYIGVRDWLAVSATAVVTALASLFSFRMSKMPSVSSASVYVLTAAIACVVALTSCYMGPFTVVPTCAASSSIILAMNVSRRERWVSTAIISLGALAPYAVERLGWFAPAYKFELDRVIVFARGVNLPEVATNAAMLYSTLSFVLLAAILMGRVRDALQVHESRQFLQAWYLRELFPARSGEQSKPTS